MNWLEKVRYLKSLKDKNTYMIGGCWIDLDFESNLWQRQELESLIKTYTYLPESYINFIKEFDNLSIAHVVFYGSKDGNVLPLEQWLDYWSKILGKSYFPFAKDVDGSTFALNNTGEVIRFQLNPTDAEKLEKYADSFEEFVGECLLGAKYPGFDYADKEDDDFYLLLRHLGWA